MPLRGKS